MSNWRSVLGYRIEPTEFKVGARVMLDLSYRNGRWSRTEYPDGSIGTIVKRYKHSRDSSDPAWFVKMDSGVVEYGGNLPTFYQKDLKLI